MLLISPAIAQRSAISEPCSRFRAQLRRLALLLLPVDPERKNATRLFDFAASRFGNSLTPPVTGPPLILQVTFFALARSYLNYGGQIEQTAQERPRTVVRGHELRTVPSLSRSRTRSGASRCGARRNSASVTTSYRSKASARIGGWMP